MATIEGNLGLSFKKGDDDDSISAGIDGKISGTGTIFGKKSGDLHVNLVLKSAASLDASYNAYLKILMSGKTVTDLKSPGSFNLGKTTSDITLIDYDIRGALP